MNVHLGRWIKDPAKVQQVLDSLPKEPDQSENIEHFSEHVDRTDSDKSGYEDQDLKNEKSQGGNKVVESTSKIEDNVS